MSRLAFSDSQQPLAAPARDSLELASLAESEQDDLPSSGTSSTAGISSSRRLSLENEDPLDSANPAGRRPLHGRSYSVSSAFDFTPALFPLSSTTGGYTALGDPSQIGISLDRRAAIENVAEFGIRCRRARSRRFAVIRDGVTTVGGMICKTSVALADADDVIRSFDRITEIVSTEIPDRR